MLNLIKRVIKFTVPADNYTGSTLTVEVIDNELRVNDETKGTLTATEFGFRLIRNGHIYAVAFMESDGAFAYLYGSHEIQRFVKGEPSTAVFAALAQIVALT